MVAALLLTAGVGLAWRRLPLSGWLAEYPGDAAYATAAFFLFASGFPGWSTRRVAVGASAFATAVELLQLANWPWLRQCRDTGLGALLLGQGFQILDLVAYAVGVAIACVVDVTFLVGSPHRGRRPDRLPASSPRPRG